jgi:hypothetical protein
MKIWKNVKAPLDSLYFIPAKTSLSLARRQVVDYDIA